MLDEYSTLKTLGLRLSSWGKIVVEGTIPTGSRLQRRHDGMLVSQKVTEGQVASEGMEVARRIMLR